jgi:HAMP domain-containing protein
VSAAFRRRPSLRRRLRVTGIAGAVAVALVIAAILAANVATSDRLTRATERFAQEQAIADRINQAVIQELVAVSSLWGSNGPQAHRRFTAAGDEVYQQVRGYLVRNLTPEERLQVEAIKEDHARLEVAASRTADLIGRGQLDAAGEASGTMIDQASRLQDDLGRLLGMRRADLDRLRGWQVAWLRRMYLAAGALGILLLVGIVALEQFLRRRVMKPLSTLNEAARKIGEGDLGIAVPEAYDEEFSTLAATFNGMTQGLRAMTADLETRRAELAAALDQLELAQEGLLRSEKLSAMGPTTPSPPCWATRSCWTQSSGTKAGHPSPAPMRGPCCSPSSKRPGGCSPWSGPCCDSPAPPAMTSGRSASGKPSSWRSICAPSRSNRPDFTSSWARCLTATCWARHNGCRRFC